MSEKALSLRLTLAVGRWTARILSVLILIVVAIIASNEGFHFGRLNALELAATLFFGITFLGLLSGLFSDRLGAGLTLFGMAGFLVCDFLRLGALPHHYVFAAAFITGILFLAVWNGGRILNRVRSSPPPPDGKSA